jgi:hypothetical protein
MRELHWYHDVCVPKSGKTASAGPKQGLCAACGKEGLVSQFQVGTWEREPVVDARTKVQYTDGTVGPVGPPVEVTEAVSEEVAESIHITEGAPLGEAAADEIAVLTEEVQEEALPDTAVEEEPEVTVKVTLDTEELDKTLDEKAKKIEELEEQLKALKGE